MYRFFCRIYQAVFRLATPLLPWRRPVILHSTAELVQRAQAAGVTKVLLVTDKVLTGLGLPAALMDALNSGGIGFVVYDNTCPNPTIDNVEEALVRYRDSGCNGIIAFGGGSPMDCAKALGARVVHPRRSLKSMRGLFKVLHRLPFFVAVPTTAGTGSETTVAAVVVDSATCDKFVLNDISLVPHYALLDPALTVGLPRFVTATTGLDALVHAVEAYIGHSNTKQTRCDALAATELIFANLRKACSDGSDLEARRNMQQAAFLAGAAFTRAYVGNIHALSHALSGRYGIAHGLANAVIMPYVLADYAGVIDKPMAQLSMAAGIGSASVSDKENAVHMLDAIRKLNTDLDIGEGFVEILEEDIEALAAHAAKEANPLYPVPVIYLRADMERMYRLLQLEKEEV